MQDESASSNKEATNIVEKIDKEIPSTNEIYISNNTKSIRVKVPSKNGEMNLTSNSLAYKPKKEQLGKESFPSKMIKFKSHVEHEQKASFKCSETKLINHKKRQETENRTSCFGGVLRPTKVNYTETSIGNKTDTTKKIFQSDQRGQSAVKCTSPEVTSCKIQNLRRSILKSLSKSPTIAIKSQDVQENSESKDWELEIKQNRVEAEQSVVNDSTKRPDPWHKEYVQRLLILGDLEPNTSENTRQKDLEPLEKDVRVINVELGPPMEVDSIMQMSGKNIAPGIDSVVCSTSNAAEEIMAKDQGNAVCVLLMEKPPPPDFTIAGKEIVGSKVEIKAIVCKLEQPLTVKESLSDNSLPTKEQMLPKSFIGTEKPDSSGTERKIVGFNTEQPLDLKVWSPNVSPGILESECQRHIVQTHKPANAIDKNEKEVDDYFELPLEVKVSTTTLEGPEKVPQDSVKTDKAAISLEIHRKVAASEVEPTLKVKASPSQEDIVNKRITNLPFEIDEKEINCNLELPLEAPNTLHGQEKVSNVDFIKSDKATFSLKTKVSALNNSLNVIDDVPPKNYVKTVKLELSREINRIVIGKKLEVLDVEVSRSENCLSYLGKMSQSNVPKTDKSDLLLNDKVHFLDSSLKEENCVRSGRTELPSEVNINLTESHLKALKVNALPPENTLCLEKMPRENFVTADKSKQLLLENSLNFLENFANTEKTEIPVQAEEKILAGKHELPPDVKASSLDNTITTTVTTPEEITINAETSKNKPKTWEESSFLTPNAPMEKTTTQNPSDNVEQSIVELGKLLNSFEDVKELRLKGSIRNNLFESFAQKLTPAVHNGKSVNDLAQLLMDFQQSSFNNYLEEKCTIYSTIPEENDRVRIDVNEASGCLTAKSNDEICENGKEQLIGLPKLSLTKQVSEKMMEEPGIAKMPEKPSKVVRKDDEMSLSLNNFKRQRNRKLSIQKRRNILKQQVSKLSARIRIRIKRVQRRYRKFKMFVRRINSWLAISSMESFYLQQKVQHLRHISRVVGKTLMTFKTTDVAKLEAKIRMMPVVLSKRRISLRAKIKRNLIRVNGKNQNESVLEQKLVEDGDTLKPVSEDGLEESLTKRQLKMYINRKKRTQVGADRLSDQMSKTSHSNCVIDAAPASPASVVIDKSSMDQLMPELPKPLFALEQVQDQTTGYGLKTDIRESEALRNAPKRRRRQWTPVLHRYSLRSSASGIGILHLQALSVLVAFAPIHHKVKD
ncbi:uncharacterized protein [Euwallacea similis]|uniref:uncharacterized protein n=1 Tax=Euwallacea similis TaxID=1736056 RepID=UPI00344C070E